MYEIYKDSSPFLNTCCRNFSEYVYLCILYFLFRFILFLMQMILAVMHTVSGFVVLLRKPFFSLKLWRGIGSSTQIGEMNCVRLGELTLPDNPG